MKTIKKLFMVIFSLLFAFLAILAFKNYVAYGFLDAVPYGFVGLTCLIIASSINESIRKS